MGKKLDILVQGVIYMYTVGIVILALTFIGVVIYLTKIYLDKTDYNDGIKAGIYIGVFIAASLLSVVLARYAPLLVMIAIGQSD